MDIITKKILDAQYWWPKLFHDASEFSKSCDACQRIKGLAMKNLAKIIIILLKEPFRKWD